MRKVEKLIASLFFSGYFPVFPATVASAVTCLAYWFLIPQDYRIQTPIIVAVFFLGVLVSERVAREWGPDPKRVVIDEAAGMLLSLFMVPKSVPMITAAFLFFRLFDIAKPFPIRRLERLESGWGIMLDDLLAGVYTRVAVFVVYMIWSGVR